MFPKNPRNPTSWLLAIWDLPSVNINFPPLHPLSSSHPYLCMLGNPHQGLRSTSFSLCKGFRRFIKSKILAGILSAVAVVLAVGTGSCICPDLSCSEPPSPLEALTSSGMLKRKALEDIVACLAMKASEAPTASSLLSKTQAKREFKREEWAKFKMQM